jgi:hypothetical protein
LDSVDDGAAVYRHFSDPRLETAEVVGDRASFASAPELTGQGKRPVEQGVADDRRRDNGPSRQIANRLEDRPIRLGERLES